MVKGTEPSSDLKLLRMFGEEKKVKRYLCVSFESGRQNIESLRVLPYREFLKALREEEH
jgi:hypothetical protein